MPFYYFWYTRSRIKSLTFGEVGTLDLLINQLEQDDAGTYKCTAVYAGNQNLEVAIDVEVYSK